MKIVILGGGYVGAVTGLCLSDIGHRVTCYDFAQKKLIFLNLEKFLSMRKAFKAFK